VTANAPSQPKLTEPLRVGRYALHESIGSGGMAAVYIGRLHGASGFAKTVAIKRLHPQYANDPEFSSMFVDEARLAARVVHPNVVSTLDVVHSGSDLLLIMEFVDGDSLSEILRGMASHVQRMPMDVASSIFCGVLSGLHAAHVAKGDDGSPLNIVHRDMSPENVIVSVDGIARVLDFGIAKASGKSSVTRDGTVKGKLAYMAPEQVLGKELSPRTDIFAVGAVMYELITGLRAFKAENDGATLRKLLYDTLAPVKSVVPDVPDALDAVIMKALSRDASGRFESAAAMQDALEAAVSPASSRKTAEWLRGILGDQISRRAQKVATVERGSGSLSRVNLSVPPPAAEGSVHLPMHAAGRKPMLIGGLVAAVVLSGMVAVASSGTDGSRVQIARKSDTALRTLSASAILAAAPSLPATTAATVPAVTTTTHAGVRPGTRVPPGPITKPSGTKLYGRD
jgi:eukaryotic-like serine/threonine-protein kinase